MARWPAARYKSGKNMTLRIQLVRSADALGAIVPAWEELAAHACEPNPFYEPWFLLPALRSAEEEKAGAGVGLPSSRGWAGEWRFGTIPFISRRRLQRCRCHYS